MRLGTTSLILAVVALLAAAALAGSDEPLTVRDYQIDALISVSRETVLDSVGLPHRVEAYWDAWGDDEEREGGTRGESGFLDEDELVELILSSVAPASWEEEGTSIEASGGRLSVSARRDVQDAVARLLASLWSEAGKRVRVDVQVVNLTPEAFEKLERAGVAAALRTGRLSAEQVRAVVAESSVGVAGSTVSRPAQRSTVRQLNSVSYVRDFDVEIAQGSIVADPIVGWAREGLMVDVRPHLLADGGIFLEAFARSARLEKPLRRLNLEADAMGTLDLPACRIARVFTAGRLAADETLAILRREASGVVAVIMLTPRVQKPAGRDSLIRILPVSALTWRRIGYEVSDREIEESRTPEVDPPRPILHGDAPAYLRPDSLEELLRGRVLSEAREEDPLLRVTRGRILATADSDRLRGLVAQVRSLEDRAVRTWRVHAKLLETARESRKVVAEFHLDAPQGRSVCYAAGIERAFVSDWDVEVAQESRVGDPVVGHAFGGFTLNVRLDATGVPGQVAARLDFLLSTLDPEIEVRRPGNDVTGIIEIPKIGRVHVEREVVVGVGETTVIDGGRLASGKGLVLELAVE